MFKNKFKLADEKKCLIIRTSLTVSCREGSILNAKYTLMKNRLVIGQCVSSGKTRQPPMQCSAEEICDLSEDRFCLIYVRDCEYKYPQSQLLKRPPFRKCSTRPFTALGLFSVII